MNKRPYIPHLLIIAGNARNVGKTTFASSLISKFAPYYKIIAFKVSTIKPSDELWHGHHEEPIPDTFHIDEEVFSTPGKDTGRMLAAGAEKAFYIRSREEFVPEAISELMKRIPTDCMLICESRSLGEFVKPGLLVIIHKLGNVPGVKDIASLESKADVIIHTKEQAYYPDAVVQAFRIHNMTWVYNPNG